MMQFTCLGCDAVLTTDEIVQQRAVVWECKDGYHIGPYEVVTASVQTRPETLPGMRIGVEH